MTVNTSGGVEPIDPVERLSPIPSASQPLLVELGVAQGGKRVLFAVQPGTLVETPTSAGTAAARPARSIARSCRCPSGPIENYLHPERRSSGASSSVTAITAVNHPSVAAANKARNAVSPVGAQLLTNSSLAALSLFQYEPSVGAVVDLRNLTVGGM